MKILVANLGSTSFKYRLFDMNDETLLARGGVDRIGAPRSQCTFESAGRRETGAMTAPDHAVAVRFCLEQLAHEQCLTSTRELAAIGFKAVHAQGLTGVHAVDDRLLAAMEAYNDVAPAHNPPYVSAMRLLAKELPDIPHGRRFRVGLSRNHSTGAKLYAVPLAWAEKYGVKRHGFHGASHRYIAERTAQLLGKPEAKIISCHLGGSSSMCAIKDGRSRASSMGMSPQSGLPQNNRVGDFDAFALPALLRATGLSLPQILDELANRSGLLGISGFNDLRDMEAAAAKNDCHARLALDMFVESVRDYLGAYLLLLGGADAIVFTGGIGENSASMRAAICADLDWLGIQLDSNANAAARGEMPVHAATSRVQLWIMPTNEELIVARQAKEFLQPVG